MWSRFDAYPRLFFPSGQRMRRSSISPAPLERSEQGRALVPAIQAASYRCIDHFLSLLRPVPVQEVFDREHPAVHAFDLRQLVCPGGPFGHDGLQARQLLCTACAYRPPFFESCCRLASISSNKSVASTVAYLRGSSPSVLSAVKIPAA